MSTAMAIPDRLPPKEISVNDMTEHIQTWKLTERNGHERWEKDETIRREIHETGTCNGRHFTAGDQGSKTVCYHRCARVWVTRIQPKKSNRTLANV